MKGEQTMSTLDVASSLSSCARETRCQIQAIFAYFATLVVLQRCCQKLVQCESMRKAACFTFDRLSVLQTCCQLVMKRSMSGSAWPTSSQRHLLAVRPPSMLQHTMAFSSLKLLVLSMGHTLQTCSGGTRFSSVTFSSVNNTAGTVDWAQTPNLQRRYTFQQCED